MRICMFDPPISRIRLKTKTGQAASELPLVPRRVKASLCYSISTGRAHDFTCGIEIMFGVDFRRRFLRVP